jgi:hypothetical protein
MSQISGNAISPVKDNQSERLSLMETDEDLATSQELPPPKLDYCVECKDQEVTTTSISNLIKQLLLQYLHWHHTHWRASL